MPDQDVSNDLASQGSETTVTVTRHKGKVRPPARNVRNVGSRIVRADTVQAEDVPTVPIESFQTLSTLRPEVSVRPVSSTSTVRLPVPLVQTQEHRHSFSEWLQLWWDAMRPAYLPLSIMPVLVGTTLAWTQSISPKTPFGQFHILHFIAVLVAVVVLQIGAQLVNDYYDYIHGVDTGNTLGPGGLIQQGLIKPIGVLNIGLILLVLGAVIGAVVALSGGWIVYLFGLIGVLCAYFYSATSRSLSSLTLGELVSFYIFGPLLTVGAYLVQTSMVGVAGLLNVFLYSLPLGLLATAVVHVNNMRDAESDAQAKKHTLASLILIRWCRVVYLFLVLGAYAIIVALAIPHNAPHLVLITLWTLPILLVVITGVMRATLPASLHLVLHQTLKLETYFALLLVAALIVSALFGVLPHIFGHVLPV